jgi:hypothetical protein
MIVITLRQWRQLLQPEPQPEQPRGAGLADGDVQPRPRPGGLERRER